MKTIQKIAAAICITTVFFSCSNDTKSNNEDPEAGDKYVIGYLTDSWDANYMYSFDSLDVLMAETIDMTGKGIEQGGSYIPVANTMFACATDDIGAAPFYINADGDLVVGNRIFIESTFAYGVTDDDKVLIVGASWDGSSTENELIIYDPEIQAIVNRRFDDFATEGDYFDFPTGVTVSDGKIYLSVFSRIADWLAEGGIVQEHAWIRVYDYNTLTLIDRIEDTRTTSVGMYYTNTGIIRTDSGDVYTFSSNAIAAGYTVVEGKKSGILRINKGENEFDDSYFFNIQDSSLNGKVLAAYPLGGEKAYIVYIPEGSDDINWGFLFDNYKFKSAIVDLPTQNITEVTGLPLHGGDYYYGIGSLYVEDGFAYKSFKNNTEVRIYKINIATGEATAGAKVTGGALDINAITKLSPQ